MSRHGIGRVALVGISGLLLLLVVTGIWLYRDYQQFAAGPMQIPAKTTVMVERGESLRGIVEVLQQRKYTAAPFTYWRILATAMGVARVLHVGEYALEPGMSPSTLLDRIGEGRVVQHMFTIVDGWTVAQLRASLAHVADLKHLTKSMSRAQIAERLGIANNNPEGWFLPQTYAFVLGESDLDLLARSHRAMQRTLAELWAKRASGLPITSSYQALILASVVEKETAKPAERAEIAGVFERRLSIGMRLQSDPTVIYGLGSAYHGDITFKDLATDTPYNTYTRAGLPPTPIALPGEPAIQAVLHPAAGKALYFVADGQGGHVFSDTLAEHNLAVQRYLLHNRAKP